MEDLSLLIDLHKSGYRQGPGGDAQTELALRLTTCDVNADLRVADIGCGTGASTLFLATTLKNAHVTAIDLLPDFLVTLTQRAGEQGLAPTEHRKMVSHSWSKSGWIYAWPIPVHQRAGSASRENLAVNLSL